MDMIRYLAFIIIFSSCNKALRVNIDERSLNGSSSVNDTGFSLVFDDASKFTYDNNVVEFSSSEAFLKAINLPQTQSSYNLGSYNNSYFNSTNENLTVKHKNSDTLDLRNILSAEVGSLEGYWRFENSPADSSANALSTVNKNVARFSTSSIVGSYSSTTGTGVDGVLASGIPVMNTFSVSTWIFVNEYADYARIFVKGLDENDVDWEFAADNTGQFRMSINDTCYGTYFKIRLERWSHIAITYDGANIKSYLNGQEVDSTACALIPTNLGSDLNMGANLNGFNDSQSNLDEFAIWSKALTSTDIVNIYNSQKPVLREMSSDWTPSWGDIIGYWKMNFYGDNPLELDDSSVHGHDGLITGGHSFITERKSDQSISFVGNDSQIRFTSIDSDFDRAKGSIGCWIKNEIDEGDVNNRFLFRYFVDTDNEISSRFMSDDTFVFKYKGQANTVDAIINNWSQKIPRNEWTHLVMTWDVSSADELKIYLNSNLEVTETQGTQMDATVLNYFSLGFGSNGFKGRLNECAIWSEVLSKKEISEIYHQQSEHFLGSYISSVIDTGSVSSTWDNLVIKTAIPYSKELTNSSEQADYSGVSTDLSTDLVSYWDFNETSLDSAAGSMDIDDNIGGNTLAESGGVVIDREGLHSRAIYLDGGDDHLVAFDDTSLQMNSSLTISLWMKSNGELADTGVYGGLMGKLNFSGASDYGIMVFNSGYQFIVRQSDTSYITSAALPSSKIVDGNWHHLVGVADAGAGELKVYIDGVLQTGSVNATFDGTIFVSAKDLIFGRDYNDRYFNGKLDEAAIWNRALSSDEISQLYKRGAYKLSYQVRSCSVSDCSDGQWIGAKGSDGSYFTELDNNDSILAGLPVGNPLPTAMNFEYSNYVEKPADNRYFQYKILMKSIHEMTCTVDSCPPAISEIALGDSVGYEDDYTEITPNDPISINKVNSFTLDSSGSCSLSFQISSDGVNYVYWDGSVWAASTQASESSSLVDLNSNFTDFKSGSASSDLYIKTIMKSDSTQDCHIKKVIIDNEI